NCNRTPLDLIGTHKVWTTPALDQRFQFPAQVNGILNTHVHAEAAGWRGQVRGITSNHNPSRTVIVCYQLTANPGHDGKNLEVEIFSTNSAAERSSDLFLGQRAHRAVTDNREAPPVATVDCHNGTPR